MNYYQKIGPYIKEKRLKLGMTKTELAKDVCSISYITRIENGERCPTSIILRQLSTKLGLSQENLFRALESPESLHSKFLIEELFTSLNNSDLKKMMSILEESKQQQSIFDYQIFETFRCITESISTADFEPICKRLNKLLELTYISSNIPTDIEFIIMFTAASFLKDPNDAYHSIKAVEKHLKDIQFIHDHIIVAHFYINVLCTCFESNHLDDVSHYLDKGIEYCKTHNVLVPLTDLYYLKYIFYKRIDQNYNSIIWQNKTFSLCELIAKDSAEAINLLKEMYDDLLYDKNWL